MASLAIVMVMTVTDKAVKVLLMVVVVVEETAIQVVAELSVTQTLGNREKQKPGNTCRGHP